MTWTATITDRRNEITQWAIEVIYTHPDKKPITKGYKVAGLLSDSKIRHILKSEIAQLDAVAIVDELTIVKGDIVDLTEPAAAQKSPEILAREQWQKNYGDLQRLRRAAEEGFISADDNRINALNVILKSAWLDEYKDLL